MAVQDKKVIRMALNDDKLIEVENLKHEERNKDRRIAYACGNGSCAWREF